MSCRRGASLIPLPRAPDDVHDRKHDRHLDQYANDRGKCGARLEAEQGDGCCDGELEEVAGPDKRRRPRHTPFDA
jgi:hypothetical protein